MKKETSLLERAMATKVLDKRELEVYQTILLGNFQSKDLVRFHGQNAYRGIHDLKKKGFIRKLKTTKTFKPTDPKNWAVTNVIPMPNKKDTQAVLELMADLENQIKQLKMKIG